MLLLWVASSMKLRSKGKPFAAGIVFSLCAAKFQLLLLTPVLLVAQRSWRFTRGLLTGGTVLATVSFLAAGRSWPQQMYEMATRPEFSPNPGLMPNRHGALSYVPFGSWLEVLVGLSVLIAVWIVARRTSFPYQPVVEVKVAKNRVQPANSLQAKCFVSWVMTGGELVAVPIFPSCTTFATGCYALACSPAGGLLISYHSYLPDYALLLPACLTILVGTEVLLLRAVSLFLCCPRRLIFWSDTRGFRLPSPSSPPSCCWFI